MKGSEELEGIPLTVEQHSAKLSEIESTHSFRCAIIRVQTLINEPFSLLVQ